MAKDVFLTLQSKWLKVFWAIFAVTALSYVSESGTGLWDETVDRESLVLSILNLQGKWDTFVRTVAPQTRVVAIAKSPNKLSPPWTPGCPPSSLLHH